MSRWQSPDAARIKTAVVLGWLTACGPQQMMEGTLGRGERAAIARAMAIGAGLLRSKHAGLVPSVAPLINQLRAGGQRFGRAVVAQALSAAGEAPE